MRNNYKQLSKSPSEPSLFKRSASHSFRSSFRLSKKRNIDHTASCSSLPSFVPPKAAALLEIPLPAKNLNSKQDSDENLNIHINSPKTLKVATIRRRSVWANSSASKKDSPSLIHNFFPIETQNLLKFVLEISLPSHLDYDRKLSAAPLNAMHIRGISSNKNMPQRKADSSDIGDGSCILREINKNTSSSSDQFKVSKKHKFGHAAKKPETSVLCGKLSDHCKLIAMLITTFGF